MRLFRVHAASNIALAISALVASVTPAQPKAAALKMALVNIKSVYSDTPDAKANQAALDANLKRHF
jgi:Skp family chaperone for outer membrane proteins